MSTLRLTLLGGLGLTEGTDADRLPAETSLQPRHFALLALLATAGDAGRSRDKLLAWLWSEVTAPRARHALRQALYRVRASLGRSAIVEHGSILALDSTFITSDVHDFRAAFDARDWAGAIRSYAGPFLDGFFIADAPEFEQWVEQERARLARDLAYALEALATDAATAGNHADAARCWQQLAILDPLNSRVAAKFVRSIAASGDVAGALRQVQLHQKLRRDELGVAPDASLQSLARELAPEAHEDLRRAIDGQFSIERLIERRSAASAYLARERATSKTVVLHVLSPAIIGLANRDVLLGYLYEAMRIDHPGIVPVVAAGVAGEYVYYAMAYAPGDTLRTRLDREQQLAIPDILVLARSLADALASAHAGRVLHLDLKPKHIVFNDGRWRIRQLGVASAVRAAVTSDAQQTAVAYGTPAYMSPEQAAGDAHVDARSDLYSLGCVLYHALTGTPPLMAATPQGVIGRRLTERVPSLRGEREGVPRLLDAAVRRLLARAPGDRYLSALELLNALAPLATAAPAIVEQVPRPVA